MLRDLDEHADYPGDAFPRTAGPSQHTPCELPDCDGWINTVDAAGTLLSAAPCPDVEHRRAGYHVQDQWDLDECPF